MTFYLSDEPKPREAHPAPTDNAGTLEVLGAAWDAQFIEQGSWLRVDRKRMEIEAELRERIGMPEETPPSEGFADPRNPTFGVRGVGLRTLLDEASRIAATDPARLGGLPLDEAAFEAEVNRRLKADYEEAQAVLSMGGRGAGVTEFAGRMLGAATDPVGLGFMLAGGPVGTGLRGAASFVGREALLGGMSEAFVLPGMYDMAERLDLPEPNAAAQIALGTLASGALAGGIVAAQRGAYYFLGRARGEAGAAPGGDVYDDRAAVNEAEAALLNDAPPPPPPAVADDGVALVARKIVGVESSGNPMAKNPASSASGLGQFTDATWLATIKRHRPDIAIGRSDAQLLALKSDRDLGWEMTVAHTRDNLAALRSDGLPTDEGSVYLAHFLGIGGARLALRADPSAPVSAVMSPAAIRANANVRYGGKFLPDFTVGELRRWAEVKMGRAVDPGGSYRPGTRAGYTTPDQVVTPAGTRVGVRYEIVDASTLVPASGRLQPRDRSRAASDEQIAEMASRLDPARLMPSVETDRGAPIVGPDGVVESGNGRVMAIVRAAQEFPDRYEAYRAAIAEVAEIPEGVERPVLIARRTSDLDGAARESFVRESNASAIARMSGSEQAGTDAAALAAPVLALFEPGQSLTAPGNRAFVKAALARIPQAERAGLVDAGGALNVEGARRLRQAMFARAYEAPDLTRIMSELDDGQLRGVIEALGDAAPAWAALRQEIADGVLNPALDATPQLLDAVRLIARARATATASGGKLSVRGAIDDALAQGDLIGGAVPAETRGFVDVFYRGGRARSAADVSGLLHRYVDEARIVGSTEASLFGDIGSPGPREILDAIRRDDPETDLLLGGAGARAGADEGRTGPGRSDPDDRWAGPDGSGAGGRDPGADDAGRLGGAAARPEADGALDPAPVDVTGVDDAAFAQGASSPDLMAAERAALEELRARLEAEGDFDLATGNPGETISARALLDELDEDQEIADVIAACQLGGARDG